jgi:hypothetical protein
VSAGRGAGSTPVGSVDGVPYTRISAAAAYGSPFSAFNAVNLTYDAVTAGNKTTCMFGESISDPDATWVQFVPSVETDTV